MQVFKKKLKDGFTLVELLVTISIFVILTGVVLFNQNRFNSTILLTNLAYDTALTIRQAQTYGINIKEFNPGASNSKFVPYGVHFDKDNANKSFILFADINTTPMNKFNGNTLDRCNVAEGCVNRYSIKRGNYISNLYFGDNCDKPASTLDILFQRPNPDAKIFANGDTNIALSKACIKLGGVDGSIRTVNVQANGLIEIVQ